MALYDGKISIRSSLEQIWWAAEMTLTPAQQVVSATKPAAFAALDENYGYVFVFRERGNGEVALRLLIDEAARVREVFATYRGSDALNMLATLSSSDRELILQVAQDGEQRLREIKTFAERATIAPQLNTLPPEMPSLSVSAFTDDVSSFHQPAEKHAPQMPMTVSRMDQRVIRPGFGIPALIFVIVTVILIIGGMVLYAIGRTTPNRFDNADFSVNYLDGWAPMDLSSFTPCKNAVPPCALVLGKTPINSTTIQFRPITTNAPRTVLDIETNEWNNMKAVNPALEFVRQEKIEVAGKPAVRITYRRNDGTNNLAVLRTLVVVSDTRFMEIVVTALNPARYADYREEIDRTINSLMLKG